MTAIIYERLKKYSPKTFEEENYALKEILQEIILCALSETEFFKYAIFQGGTSLRIFYNIGRFSEDLDFILKHPNIHFKWQPFLQAIKNTCNQYGVVLEIIDKSKAGSSVQKILLKNNSIVKFLNLSFHDHLEQKLTIKLELDVNPPAGSNSEIKFLDFPFAAEIELQDLSSNFAGKSHALLCRKYIKGRDWYDFLWYITKEIKPNFIFLSNAINQLGPWAGQNISVTPTWYISELEKKIYSINWPKASDEVFVFLNEQDRKTLKLWGIPFFLDRINKLKDILKI
jgi:hypothetical protein